MKSIDGLDGGNLTPTSIQMKQEEDELMELDHEEGRAATWNDPRRSNGVMIDVDMSDSDDKSDSRRFSLASQLSPPVSQHNSTHDLTLSSRDAVVVDSSQPSEQHSSARHVSALDLLVGVAEQARRSVLPGHGKMSIPFFGHDKREKKAAAAAAAAVTEKKGTWAHVEVNEASK
jgi:hypothetical protein